MNLTGMARFYYEAVKRGERTIDRVPKPWRARVEKKLEEDEKREE